MSREQVERYEQTDARVGSLVSFAVALSVLIAVSLGVTFWIVKAFARTDRSREQPSPLAEFRAAPIVPELEARPGASLASVHAREEELLTTYGWVDEQNGIVRVPIERALELVLERGLPARQPSVEGAPPR